MSIDIIERDIYAQICKNDGIKAREIARNLRADRSLVNHYLYASPYMRDLCCRDQNYRWHGLIRQTVPHTGLRDYSGYYALVKEFLEEDAEGWLEEMIEGCRHIGRNLNDKRGLFHSFQDSRETMLSLFTDLNGVDYENWEIVFELRIRKSKHIRIYADVLVVTDSFVFSLEFKMKDRIEPEEVAQAAKYCEYLEVIFGPQYDVVPALVLTKASDLYTYEPLKNTTAEIPVCSGDMLFNVFDEYLGFLKE